MVHECDVPRCDGTDLGHDLAVEFPAETQAFDDAMDRLRDRTNSPGQEASS